MEANQYPSSQKIFILVNIFWISMAVVSAFSRICPTTTTVAKGQNSTLGCHLDSSVIYIYWYRGDSVNKESKPLLEGNQTTTTIHQSMKFDVTSEGDILIYDATDEDEDDYTMVVEFIDGTNHEETISVHLDEAVNKSETDNTSSWKVPVIITVVVVLLLVIAGIVAVVIYIVYYRNRETFPYNKDSKVFEQDELAHLLLETNTGNTKIPLNKRDETLQVLVKALEDYYTQYSLHKLFPCKEDVETGRLLAECQCLVTSEDGKEIIVSSDKCLTQDILRIKQRILLTGAMGFGKSTLIHKIVDEWRTDTNKTFVLFYMDLFDTSADNYITDAIIEMIAEARLSIEEVNRIIMSEKCIFVLDNIPFFRTGIKSNQIEESRSESQKRLSVFDLLDVNIATTDMPNVNILAAFGTDCRMNSSMSSPCFKIKLRGLNQTNTSHYIEQTIEYFESLNPQVRDKGDQEPELGDTHNLEESNTQEIEERMMEISKQYTEEESSQNKFIKRKSNINVLTSRSDYINNVNGFLRNNEFIEEFCRTPLWLTTIIHNKMASLLNIANHAANIEKVTTLTRLLIDCLLQRYLNRTPESSVDSTINLLIKLGKYCCDNDLFNHNQTIEHWERSLDQTDVNAVINIGMLQIEQYKNDNEIEGGDMSYLLTFYHSLFMEYCVGKYVSEEENVREILKQYSNEKLKTFVNFINGSDQLIEDVFEELKDRKMWNNAIEYLYESHDMNEPIRVNDAVVDVHINEFKSRYHQNALTSYLQNRSMRKCTSGTVYVDGDCSLIFLTSLRLPSIDTLIINERQLSEEDVQLIIDWACTTEGHCFLNMRFIHCRLPEKCGNLEQMKSVPTDIEIQRQDSDGKNLQLDTCTGKWTIDNFDWRQDDVVNGLSP